MAMAMGMEMGVAMGMGMGMTTAMVMAKVNHLVKAWLHTGGIHYSDRTHQIIGGK